MDTLHTIAGKDVRVCFVGCLTYICVCALLLTHFNIHSSINIHMRVCFSGGLIALLREIIIAFATQAPKVVNVLTARLALMPKVRDVAQRNLTYRHFRKGIHTFGRWTGDDHIALLQQLPFVVGTSQRVIRAPLSARKAFIA
jgi:hypothetical protein